MKRLIFLTTVVLLSIMWLAGCRTTKVSPDFMEMSVDFNWTDGDRCSSRSPAFHISNIPEGTARLVFKMRDLDVPTYNHGGGTVEYTGSGDIPAGAFSYKGPCPPSGSHDYEFTVRAVNESGDTLLGEGQVVRTFPPAP